MKGSYCAGKYGGVRHRSARAKAAFHSVSRQPAQTVGVRKRLPFSTGMITYNVPCIGEMTVKYVRLLKGNAKIWAKE